MNSLERKIEFFFIEFEVAGGRADVILGGRRSREGFD